MSNSPFPFSSCSYSDDDVSFINQCNCLQRTQVKLDSQTEMQKIQLENFARAVNESIINQNKENDRFRKSIEEAVNAHLKYFLVQVKDNSDKIHLLQSEIVMMRKDIESLKSSVKNINNFNDIF